MSAPASGRPPVEIRITWPDGTTVTYHQVDLESHIAVPVPAPFAPPGSTPKVVAYNLGIGGRVLPVRGGEFYRYHNPNAVGATPQANPHWAAATSLVDAAISGAVRAVAAAWQTASGNDGARTPAYVNALNADPELQGRMDEVLRPMVRIMCATLISEGWVRQSDSIYYDRFAQEMHGFSDQEWADYQKEQAD